MGDFFCPHQLLDSYRQTNGSQGDEPVVLLRKNYKLSTTCNNQVISDRSPGEDYLNPKNPGHQIQAQQGWCWLLTPSLPFLKPHEISFQTCVYSLILCCHSTVFYCVIVHCYSHFIIYLQHIFCHWACMSIITYYPNTLTNNFIFCIYHTTSQKDFEKQLVSMEWTNPSGKPM